MAPALTTALKPPHQSPQIAELSHEKGKTHLFLLLNEELHKLITQMSITFIVACLDRMEKGSFAVWPICCQPFTEQTRRIFFLLVPPPSSLFDHHFPLPQAAVQAGFVI